MIWGSESGSRSPHPLAPKNIENPCFKKMLAWMRRQRPESQFPLSSLEQPLNCLLMRRGGGKEGRKETSGGGRECGVTLQGWEKEATTSTSPYLSRRVLNGGLGGRNLFFPRICGYSLFFSGKKNKKKSIIFHSTSQHFLETSSVQLRIPPLHPSAAASHNA